MKARVGAPQMTTRVGLALRCCEDQRDAERISALLGRSERRGLGRGGYVEEVGLEGVAADEQARVVELLAGAIVADVV